MHCRLYTMYKKLTIHFPYRIIFYLGINLEYPHSHSR